MRELFKSFDLAGRIGMVVVVMLTIVIVGFWLGFRPSWRPCRWSSIRAIRGKTRRCRCWHMKST